MPRGPGALQQRILDAIAGAARWRNRLCWELAGARGGIESSGDLGKSFYNGFGNAVRTLEQNGALKREKRKLTTIPEVVEHYPYRSLSGAVRKLRLDLLPHVAEILARNRQRRFNVAEHEHYVLRGMKRVNLAGFFDENLTKYVFKDQHAPLTTMWRAHENELRPHLSDARVEVGDPLFNLIIKGRELFVPGSRASHALSMSELLKIAIGAVHSAGVAEAADSLARLQEVYEKLFEKQVEVLELKNELYAVVDFGTQGRRSTLHDEALVLLREQAGALVTDLPGYEAGDPPKFGVSDWDRKEEKFPPLLHELIQKDVLQPFELLHPT